MPHNWDDSQNINAGSQAVEWPQGPLTDDMGLTFPQAGWTPLWLEAWVVQDSTGASQRTAQRSGWAPGRWTADGIPPGWKIGSFQPGLALGIALVAYQDGTGAFKQDWWLDPIDLY
ncbi:hypothetical protein B5V02_02915 [Mesorhizobium kowhaii]|uniref:Uncharacterized protein n=1 Tax=Mesorhizobium kowhaii TaxID=1300272 RepID=A0A2W7C7X9_9HYPH|nr:hypothetical protein B5V02_02915 [Mesorhizobium kowhaii]